MYLYWYFTPWNQYGYFHYIITALSRGALNTVLSLNYCWVQTMWTHAICHNLSVAYWLHPHCSSVGTAVGILANPHRRGFSHLYVTIDLSVAGQVCAGGGT